MKRLAVLLTASFLLSACIFRAPPPGWTPPADAAAAPSQEPGALPAESAVDGEEPVEPATDGSGEVSVGGTAKPGGELDTAALCTKASTCTTRVSMELCGLFDPKCLDSFHKHLDGATREKCQEKLDRLPGLVEKHGRPGYVLPQECR